MNIKELLKDADLVLRPNALFINPADRELILEAMPEVKDQYKIYMSGIVEKGKIYIMKRKDIEKYIEEV